MSVRLFLVNSRHLRPGRGFTLIELMVTVVIIGLLAALAAPGIKQRVDNYAARSAAEAIASTVRLARLRAMGRGGAVLVHYVATTEISVSEGIQGGADGCAAMPDPSCNRDWTDTSATATNQAVDAFDHTGSGEYTSTFTAGGTTPTDVELCFTPAGRTLFRTGGGGGAFAPMTDVFQIAMVATGGIGLTRRVLILPNGTSRVQL